MTIRSVSQTAQILGVNESRVRQFILAGRLRAMKIGGRWIVRDQDIIEFNLKERRPGRPPHDEFVLAAKNQIERRSKLCFDVAANMGQIFDNVKHMQWFVDAVADELRPPGKGD